jgi:hypothetical protein
MRDFLENVKRFLRGEDAPGRPAVIRPVCYACREPIIGPGYSFRGRRFCDSMCIPPFLVNDLAGDPR